LRAEGRREKKAALALAIEYFTWAPPPRFFTK
jgi:hypothetical protein